MISNQPAIRNQGGFTLVEIAIVVAIAAVILVIAMRAVPTVLANNRANAEMQELPLVITNIQKIYTHYTSFSGATLNSVIRLNAFPADRVIIPAIGPATAINRWGGAITLSVDNLVSIDDLARLVYQGVTERECKAVIMGVAGMVRRIYVDSANGGTAGGGILVKNDGSTVDLAALGTACGIGTNSITYDIGK